MERRLLGLRRLAHLAEHLRRRRLVEADRVVLGAADDADRLEHAQDADAGDVGGELGLAERQRHEAHGAEVVDLVGLDLLDRGDERRQVAQVAVDQLERRVLVDARAGPSGCSGPGRARTPGSPSRSRNSDMCRPSWPVIPVTSARFMAADASGPVRPFPRLGCRDSVRVDAVPVGSSWWRNSAQRASSSVSPIAAGGLAEPGERPGGSPGWSRGASARSPSPASPTGAAGRGRGGSRPGSRRRPRRRRGRAGRAGPSASRNRGQRATTAATASRRELRAARRARSRAPSSASAGSGSSTVSGGPAGTGSTGASATAGI